MSKILPPKWIDRFLSWFCSDHLLEEIQGDLHEAYQHRQQQFGKRKADYHFFWDVLRFCRPYAFERHSRSKQFLPMYKNYFKIATRNLLKRKVFTALHLLGLAVGISTVMLVALYLTHELTYDSSHPASNNVFRLVNNYRDQTYTCMFFKDYFGSDYDTQMRLLNHLKGYDDVTEACHFVPSHSAIGPNEKVFVKTEDRKLIFEKLLYTNTGQEFDSIFPQLYLQGNPDLAFSAFDRVVLTESSARKLYGESWSTKSLIGTALEIQKKSFVVGGVIADIPGNVHFEFDLLIYQQKIPSWGAYTYVKVGAEADISRVMTRLNTEVELVYPDYKQDVLQKGISSVALQEIHFTEGMLYELKPIANTTYLITFGLVGIIILLIIWTNYTNLSIAMYAGRQRELGVRKLMGARAHDVKMQILTEAMLLTIFCLPFAWLLVFLGLPYLNSLMEVKIDQYVMFEPYTLIPLASFLIFTGIISALYPAIIFSSKSLLRLFSSKLVVGKISRFWNIRNGLLTTQFFLLIGLMSMTFIIKNQMSYVQRRPPGFDQKGVLFFGINGKEKFTRLKNRLEKFPQVIAVGSGMVPGNEMYNQLTYTMKGQEEVLSDGTLIYTSLGSLQVLGIESDALHLLGGQDSVLIINQTAAEKLAAISGIPAQDLLGETLVTEPEWENDTFGNGQHYSIAGIIDNFDYFSLRYPSQSLIIEVFREPDWVYNALVKIESADWFDTVSKIEDAYLAIEPEVPFDFTFLDDHMNELYTREQNAGILTTILTSVCVILAVMGLIGVVGFITFSRQREIGIRKVFGASVVNILVSLAKNYVWMIAAATLLAIPFSLLLGKEWLKTFAYRISPDLWTVFLAGTVTLTIVVVVVVLQSVKSARINPVDILRYE
ncbi:MAG: permease prefix domain 2-containing transporter [Bacteroidota bacterium]